jgi:hypothetical protein
MTKPSKYYKCYKPSSPLYDLYGKDIRQKEIREKNIRNFFISMIIFLIGLNLILLIL